MYIFKLYIAWIYPKITINANLLKKYYETYWQLQMNSVSYWYIQRNASNRRLQFQVTAVLKSNIFDRNNVFKLQAYNRARLGCNKGRLCAVFCSLWTICELLSFFKKSVHFLIEMLTYISRRFFSNLYRFKKNG